MPDSIVLDKALKFALRTVAVYKHLTEERKEYVLSKQLLISAAFTVKHIKSALHSRQGRFHGEMAQALGKALDCELWLLLLKAGDWLTGAEYRSLNDDCVEIIKMTSSITKTTSTDE
jgi:four helix bundle protein